MTSHFRYSDLVPNEPAGAEAGARSRLVTSSMMSSEMYNEIKELYITAAQRAPEKDIDSNVQASILLLCSVSVTTQRKEAQNSGNLRQVKNSCETFATPTQSLFGQ